MPEVCAAVQVVDLKQGIITVEVAKRRFFICEGPIQRPIFKKLSCGISMTGHES